jgi:hypothetical protein
MSAHFAPDYLFNPQVADTSNSDLFFTMYEEMYYAAKDTISLERVNDFVQLIDSVGQIISNQKIVKQ